MPEHDPEELVKTAFAIPRRQLDALRATATKEDRSMGYYVRKAIDRWFGFDKATVESRDNEKGAA